MQLVSLVIFCIFQSNIRCEYVSLKKDWIQWLTKAAAAIIISSLPGVVLVTEFYDIMTSAAAAASIPVFPQSCDL